MSQSPAARSSTTLGATLIGLSASLFTLDVGGTYWLDHQRTTVAPEQGPPSMLARAAQQSDPSEALADSTIAPAAAKPHPQAPPTVTLARYTSVTGELTPVAVERTTHLPAPAPIVHVATHPIVAAAPIDARVLLARSKPNGRAAKRVARAAFVAAKPADRAVGVRVAIVAPHGRAHLAPREVHHAQRIAKTTPTVARRASDAPSAASLETARHVVMDAVTRHQHGASVISAMTYPGTNGTMVVALVVRTAHGRWYEKGVVRRDGDSLHLLGIKLRDLPYAKPRVADAGQTRLAESPVPPVVITP